MNVAEHLVGRLVDEGVEVVFTLPGEQHDAIFAALAGTGIEVIHVRHEQAAALMAYGYARSSQRIGVFLVLSGPGVLNAATGLATAYAGDARVLCLAAQIPTPVLGRSLGIPHEIPDQLGVLRSLTGWAARVATPAAVGPVLAEAFDRLRHGRPRPVAVEIPVDVLGAQVDDSDPWTAPAPPASHDPWAIDAACRIVSQARCPIVFVGSGARRSGTEIAELAQRLQAPVTTELGGRGVISDEHQWAVSLPVAHRLWPQVDVVVAVGTRLLRPQVEWGIEGLQIVRVDLDEEEINRVGPPAVAIVGDATEAVRAMLAQLPQAEERPWWCARIDAARQEVGAEIARLTPQVEFLAAMRSALPDDGFFVDEMTQLGYAARLAFPVRNPSTYVLPTYVGALGSGFATALGVQVAHPDRAVLSISGDGGFLFTAAELATAVQNRLGVAAVVFNDNSFGNVKRSQRKFLAEPIATELHNPCFVRFAESFGAVGVRAADPVTLHDELAAAFRRRTVPTVIEVPVGELPNPWPLIRLPRVR